MYPSGVFSKICNEHSRHYSTIPSGKQTVLKNLTFLYIKLLHCDAYIAPSKGIRFLLVNSGILSGLKWNPDSLQRLESRIIKVVLTKTGIQYLESAIHSKESRIQNCLGFHYMGRHIANVTSAVCLGKQDRSML